jgi:SSS family solute:Na+ symporter
MGCSTLVVEDIVKTLYKKKLEGSSEMLLSRITVLLVSLLSFALALTVVGILRTITTALALTTSFTFILISGIYFPKILRRAAGFCVVLASLLLWIIWTYFPSLRIGPELIYAEWVVCGGIIIAFALLAKEPAGDLFADPDEIGKGALKQA